MRVIQLVLLFIIISFPVQTFSAGNNMQFDLSLNPDKILFDLSNIKPGDSVERVLTILNNGEADFNYLVNGSFLEGSELFYEQLLLRIEEEKGLLFEGKLKDFQGLEPRLLGGKKEEKLLFYIKVPEDLGNQFQGLTSKFQFKLYVEGTLGGVLPVDNRLPDTATNMFNYFALGVALIASGATLIFIKKKRKFVKNRL